MQIDMDHTKYTEHGSMWIWILHTENEFLFSASKWEIWYIFNKNIKNIKAIKINGIY